MKLNTKSRYGARAILEIAKAYNHKPVKRKDIVRNQDIPESYLENILIILKQAGLIRAIRGPQGGFQLRFAPSQITMLDVIQAFEGDIAPVECLEKSQSCSRFRHCLTRPVWTALYKAQVTTLSGFTLEALIQQGNESLVNDFSI